MPWSMIALIPAYSIGEMWIGVCIAVVVELVPSDLTASAVAVYFFIIQLIGGNMNLLETPIRKHINMRTALLILFPGMYLLGALFFIILLVYIVKCSSKNTTQNASMDQYISSQTPIKGAEEKTDPTRLWFFCPEIDCYVCDNLAIFISLNCVSLTFFP